MVNTTKFLVFMVISHTMLFTVASAGFLPMEGGSNPHKEYVGMFLEGGAAQQQVGEAAQQDQSGFIESVTSMAVSIPIIGDLYQIVFAPYILIDSTVVPDVFVWLIRGILGVIEFASVASFIRGVEL
ncbi:MAG: hypothetical protein ABEJ93_02795 [Candidatus Nanohalobium sp.]